MHMGYAAFFQNLIEWMTDARRFTSTNWPWRVRWKLKAPIPYGPLSTNSTATPCVLVPSTFKLYGWTHRKGEAQLMRGGGALA